MYKIGIIGNGPERFGDPEGVRRTVYSVVDILGFQYGSEDTIFNVKADIGTGIWSAESCRSLGYKYHLFLPFPLYETCMHWYDDQIKQVHDQYNNASGITICNPDVTKSDKAYRRIIDASNFVVCFWAGNKNSLVFDAIQHAFKKNTIVLDGLDELKLITNKSVKR